jgi:hypothetical protein
VFLLHLGFLIGIAVMPLLFHRTILTFCWGLIVLHAINAIVTGEHEGECQHGLGPILYSVVLTLSFSITMIDISYTLLNSGFHQPTSHPSVVGW